MSTTVPRLRSPVREGSAIGPERIDRVFYLLAGCLLVVIAVIGFQQFYLHGKASNGGPVTRQIGPLVVLHGILMSIWVLGFVAQSSLILAGKRRLHMILGIVGALAAAGLVVVGMATAIGSVHYNPREYEHLWGARRFLSSMLTNVLGFGVLAAIGLKFRRRAEIHRPMMFWATLFMAAPASLFRIKFIGPPILSAIHSIFAPWVPMLGLGVLLILIKTAMTRSWDRYFLRGFAGIVVGCVVQFYVANTAWWYHLAGWVTV